MKPFFYVLVLFIVLQNLEEGYWFDVERNRNDDFKKEIKRNPNTEEVNENIKGTDFSLNAIDVLKNNYPELNGSGIFICQKENQPNTADLDIRGAFLPSSLESPNFTLHASRVATIMVGQGITTPLSIGVAPQAKVYSINFNNLGPEADEFYTKNNISVVNNSFGTTIEPFYGKEAVDYDATCVRNPTLCFVFSSGNLGTSNSGKGAYLNVKGVANITGNYKMAKNILSVGAVNEKGEFVEISSNGPAYDGRVKPELVAFSNNGTSEAAAMVSGMIAVAQQAYKAKYSNILPSSSLIKAILINSADDVGRKGVDYQTGYGNVNINQAVRDINEKQFFESSVLQNEQKNITLTVPENAQNLKITLTWADVPASENSPSALVNDLDLMLSITNPTFSTWQPWVLNSYPHLDSLAKLPVRKKDNINNIEQITIEKPKSGNYNISVLGNKIQSGKQSFSIAYRWDLANQFSWIAPVKNKKVVSNNVMPIRWKSTFPELQGQLSFSKDKGKTWELINTNIDLSKGYYLWETPDIFSEILLKVAINKQEFISDAFSLSPSLAVSSLFFCADSTQLTWNHSVSAMAGIQYNVYKLNKKNNTWDKTITTNQREITLLGTNENDNFSVEPVLPSGIVGMRSDIVNTYTTGVSCFYNEFYADDDIGKVRLSLVLTTTKGIKSVTFQKLTASGIEEIETINVNNLDLNYYTLVSQMDEGINNYQVSINFINGSKIYTKVITKSLSDKKYFSVYPNPLNSQNILTIQSFVPETTTFYLYNNLGIKVIEQPITYGFNYIENTTYLPIGTYYYVIGSNTSTFLLKDKLSIVP